MLLEVILLDRKSVGCMRFFPNLTNPQTSCYGQLQTGEKNLGTYLQEKKHLDAEGYDRNIGFELSICINDTNALMKFFLTTMQQVQYRITFEIEKNQPI